MKAGPHSGDSLDKIINMKYEEEKRIGKFYWGYSGTLCHPFRVQDFCKYALLRNMKVKLLLTPTKSEYNPGGIRKVARFSTDNLHWYPLPNGVHLWNCKYAVIAKNLKKIKNAFINLNEYIVFPSKKLLSEYFRGRVNKACALFATTNSKSKLLPISYVADVISPFCIFLV